MKPVLLVRGGKATEQLLKELPSFPYILVDKHPKGSLERNAFCCYQLDTSDLRNTDYILQIARENNVQFAFTRSAYKEPNFIVATINQNVESTFFAPPESVNIIYDRFLLYNFLKSLYIPVPAYKLVNQFPDADIGCPIILKHRFTHDSRGVFIFFSFEELKTYLMQNNCYRDFILEEYVGGDEFGCYCLVLNQRVWVTLVTKRIFKEISNRFLLKATVVVPYLELENKLSEILPHIEKFVKKLKINSAVLGLQFFLDKDSKPVFFDVEFNADFIDYNLLTKGKVKFSPHAILLKYMLMQELDTHILSSLFPINKYFKQEYFLIGG